MDYTPLRAKKTLQPPRISCRPAILILRSDFSTAQSSKSAQKSRLFWLARSSKDGTISPSLVSPPVPENERRSPDRLGGLIDLLQTEYHTDSEHVSVTGHSMGGDVSVVVYPNHGLDTWTKAYENHELL